MLKSMTGFGAGTAEAGGKNIRVELSSVNRKHLDVAVRLPSALTGFEARVQKLVKEQVSRGRISGSVYFEAAGRGSDLLLDMKKAEAVVRQLRVASKRMNLRNDLGTEVLLSIPGLFQSESAELDSDALFPILKEALRAALESLDAMRICEGEALEKDLTDRLKTLEMILGKISDQAPSVVSCYREKLFQGLEAAGLKELAEDERVLREIALFGEKADISEEITRLNSHIQQFRKIMCSPEPSGRPLDFLAQELFREINTIGSKANNLEITEQVVAFKTELERIREQIQNVE